MARDRLAALRAQRQGGSPTSPTGNYEMSGLQTQDHITNGNGARAAEADPMTAFYNEISSIQDQLRLFDQNVSRISDLHSRTLNQMDDAAAKSTEALDELVAETRKVSGDLKNRIQDLEKQPTPPGQDARIRKNQTSLVRSKFIEALQNYQQVEQQYRQRYKQRVERQFKIVKPDATPQEVAAVVEDGDGSGGQIFSKALMSSDHYAESRQAYREVQDRHADIRKIEGTLAELAQLFNDMNLLVVQQDDTINAIETSAQQVEGDTEAGLVHTEKAVKSARSARRKRWICFFIFLLVLAAVGIAVGVTVGKK
ncbi:t-SNARE [Auriscalpium vulgare]|uniref:t-SNARE n=1 Tax=Auriscalpium vulgare TaxID=40419 RepID=A0ACB8S546_9AGAM|nr:t-SNARE [Auriscalpium vulgare]